MSESGDYTPAPHWAGYSFATARKSYDDHVKGSMSKAVAASVVASDLVPGELVCQSEAPLVIACDVTGSMGEWPAVIFSKLPYLEHEGKEYLGKDMQIAFAAIGDAFSDRYALQVQPFVEGAALKESLEKLIIEKGGGGSSEESYDMAALYFARNCKYPNAIRKPLLILIGDEGVYSFVDKDLAGRCAKVTLDDRLEPKKLFDELKGRYNVYIIRKPYGCSTNDLSSREVQIQKQWVEFLGEDHVVSLPDAARVVDVIFGILAKETGRIEYFKGELKDRQGKDKDGDKKIDIVMKSLKTMHTKVSRKKLPSPKDAKSITRNTSAGSKKSISLLDDDDDE